MGTPIVLLTIIFFASEKSGAFSLLATLMSGANGRIPTAGGGGLLIGIVGVTAHYAIVLATPVIGLRLGRDQTSLVSALYLHQWLSALVLATEVARCGKPSPLHFQGE